MWCQGHVPPPAPPAGRSCPASPLLHLWCQAYSLRWGLSHSPPGSYMVPSLPACSLITAVTAPEPNRAEHCNDASLSKHLCFALLSSRQLGFFFLSLSDKPPPPKSLLLFSFSSSIVSSFPPLLYLYLSLLCLSVSVPPLLSPSLRASTSQADLPEALHKINTLTSLLIDKS